MKRSKTLSAVLSASLCALLPAAPILAAESDVDTRPAETVNQIDSSRRARTKNTFEFIRPKTFEKETREGSDILLERLPLSERKKASWIDDRTTVSDTTQFPYNAICKLYMTFENAYGEEEYFVGSGYMVSPTEMMTCAHCLFARPEEGGYGIVTRLVVEPAVNGDFYPFARYDSDEEVSRYSMPALYQDPSTSEEDSFIYDFALVQFPSPLTDGSFIRLNSPSGTGPVHVSGYPAEVRGVSNETNQYEDWGTYSYMDGPFLEHDTSASGGQSGSPMLNRRDEAVGVYGYSYEDRITGEQSGIGGGVAMTLSVLDYADHALENEDGTGDNFIETPVYRVYNPNSGEHLYTKSANETAFLSRVGWTYEGVAWRNAEGENLTEVYRLYNPNVGDHHYTVDQNEARFLVSVGWRNEGVIWSAPQASDAFQNVYRLYNPNARNGAHHFTTDQNEYSFLSNNGWKAEGKAFDAR
ncbi:trypsin-like peptidase domain-containing protein [uncultured Allobaculum sp.]|uniref:trypsin-like peptidase domain-containing protein n=1 Tax=uncultured Allobaculum sp. TaxID=1187017 RepID=UPI002584EC1E|nr:trypsin-like peptidase domain-containing protein [uncultured Allobaculum sp.]